MLAATNTRLTTGRADILVAAALTLLCSPPVALRNNSVSLDFPAFAVPARGSLGGVRRRTRKPLRFKGASQGQGQRQGQARRSCLVRRADYTNNFTPISTRGHSEL